MRDGWILRFVTTYPLRPWVTTYQPRWSAKPYATSPGSCWLGLPAFPSPPFWGPGSPIVLIGRSWHCIEKKVRRRSRRYPVCQLIEGRGESISDKDRVGNVRITPVSPTADLPVPALGGAVIAVPEFYGEAFTGPPFAGEAFIESFEHTHRVTGMSSDTTRRKHSMTLLTYDTLVVIVPRMVNLKQAREHAGMTQQALSDASGVSARTVIRIEVDHEYSPNMATVWALADALGISVADLLADAPDPSPLAA